MLHIIEGANYVGKTTTLEILNKKKSLITFYHPRFNDSQTYGFDYNVVDYKPQPVTESRHTYVPRDVVYQISHMTCLKYLLTVKDKKVILDRCFLSEMVYNDLYDKKIYHSFIGVLKSFPYRVYLLTVDSDDALKQRIEARLKKDAQKTYGIRDASGFVPEPATVEEKMKAQRMIESKYKNFIKCFELEHMIIDTSNKSKKEVANAITENIS